MLKFDIRILIFKFQNVKEKQFESILLQVRKISTFKLKTVFQHRNFDLQIQNNCILIDSTH